jgi:hypothetical protein
MPLCNLARCISIFSTSLIPMILTSAISTQSRRLSLVNPTRMRSFVTLKPCALSRMLIRPMTWMSSKCATTAKNCHQPPQSDRTLLRTFCASLTYIRPSRLLNVMHSKTLKQCIRLHFLWHLPCLGPTFPSIGSHSPCPISHDETAKG